MQAFRVAVPESDLVDLRERLSRTRHTTATPGEAWAAGTPPEYLESLVEHWRNTFDWRAREEWLNSFPQFIAEISGRRVHFVHVKSASPDATPLIISHGWPYGYADMLPLVALLTDFDLVIPSLPGFNFSDAPAGPFTDETVAQTLHTLMTDVLGYHRYGTYGEDIGTAVSHSLAAQFPESVIGIFATHPAVPSEDNRANLSDREAAFLTRLSGMGWRDRLRRDPGDSTGHARGRAQ